MSANINLIYEPDVIERDRLNPYHDRLVAKVRADRDKEMFIMEQSRRKLISHLNQYKYITYPIYMQLVQCSQSKAISDLNRFYDEGLIEQKSYESSVFYMAKK